MKNLPEIIANRVYEIADANNNKKLEAKQFIDCFIRIFVAPLDQKMQFVFRVYDFDSDGKITKEDVRIILSYIDFGVADHGSQANGSVS